MSCGKRSPRRRKPAAELIYKIDKLVEYLMLGEKDREKITEPRWCAAYDLAIGRALAMKVRSFGYNAMLAEMKSMPKTFQKKDSNEWRIEPSKTINAGQAVKKMERQAAMYLKRVIDQSPGDPLGKIGRPRIVDAHGLGMEGIQEPRDYGRGDQPGRGQEANSSR